jgi:CcmD family protein
MKRLFIAFALLFAQPAFSQEKAMDLWDKGIKPVVEEGSGGFFSGENTVIMAYVAVFVLFSAYLLKLSLQTKRLSKELEEIEKRIRGGQRG